MPHSMKQRHHRRGGHTSTHDGLSRPLDYGIQGGGNVVGPGAKSGETFVARVKHAGEGLTMKRRSGEDMGHLLAEAEKGGEKMVSRSEKEGQGMAKRIR